MENEDLTKEEAMRESAYIAGMKHGYRFGQDDDLKGMATAIEARGGYLKPVAQARRAARVSWPCHDDGDEGRGLTGLKGVL